MIHLAKHDSDLEIVQNGTDTEDESRWVMLTHVVARRSKLENVLPVARGGQSAPTFDKRLAIVWERLPKLRKLHNVLKPEPVESSCVELNQIDAPHHSCY